MSFQSVLWLLLSFYSLALDPHTGLPGWILAVTLPLHHCCWAWEDRFLVHPRIRTRKHCNACLPLLPQLPFEHNAAIGCGRSTGQGSSGVLQGSEHSWVQVLGGSSLAQHQHRARNGFRSLRKLFCWPIYIKVASRYFSIQQITWPFKC